MEKQLTIGSLFSGIGGIELGFEKEGFKTLWFCENDLYAQGILRKHWPHTAIYGDITKVDWRTVPAVDILTGGFPCQDISTAGKGAGIKGRRSGLWTYYHKAIRVLRPRYAFVENVSALSCRGLNIVLADLASLGYDAEWHCVPASAVGAPHQRDRLFVIAYLPFARDGRLSVSRGRQRKKDFDIDGEGKTTSNTNSPSAKDQIHARGDITSKSSPVSDSEGERALSVQQQGQQRRSFQIRKDVSDSDSNRRREVSNRQSLKSGKTVSDPDSAGLTDLQRGGQNAECTRDRAIGDSGWWYSEPGLGRMADGVPNRVQRIRCLGNAVVPQVAEVFAQAIKEIERMRNFKIMMAKL